MKKIVLTLLALTLATPAFAGNKAPVAPAASGLMDSSGRAVMTEAAQPVALASIEPVAAPAPAKPATKPRAKKAVHKKAPAKPAAH